MVVDILTMSWEALNGYSYCPIALIPKLVHKKKTLCLSDDSSCTKVARDELVWEPDRPIHKTTTAPTTLTKSHQTTIQSRDFTKICL